MARGTLMKLGRLLALAALPAVLIIGSAASVLAGDLGQECTNPDVGYSVACATGWRTNEACIFFAEESADVPDNAGLSAFVAINASVSAESPPVSDGGEVIDTREDAAGGRSATVREVEIIEDDPFFSAGDRVYEYLIGLHSGETLAFTTTSTRDGDYEDHRATLDAMMDSLAFEETQLPDTAMRTTGSAAAH
ncbi:MAG: hypothetical protein ACRDG7_03305 [Candidatus Limnocylindria bacterium]